MEVKLSYGWTLPFYYPARVERYPLRGGAAEGGFVINYFIRVFGRSAPIKPQSQKYAKIHPKEFTFGSTTL